MATKKDKAPTEAPNKSIVIGDVLYNAIIDKVNANREKVIGIYFIKLLFFFKPTMELSLLVLTFDKLLFSILPIFCDFIFRFNYGY